MCAHILYDGMPVRFYSSVDCSGPVNWEFDGTGLEGNGEAWTCGFWTWGSGSVGIGCAE